MRGSELKAGRLEGSVNATNQGGLAMLFPGFQDNSGLLKIGIRELLQDVSNAIAVTWVTHSAGT